MMKVKMMRRLDRFLVLRDFPGLLIKAAMIVKIPLIIALMMGIANSIKFLSQALKSSWRLEKPLLGFLYFWHSIFHTIFNFIPNFFNYTVYCY